MTPEILNNQHGGSHLHQGRVCGRDNSGSSNSKQIQMMQEVQNKCATMQSIMIRWLLDIMENVEVTNNRDLSFLPKCEVGSPTSPIHSTTFYCKLLRRSHLVQQFICLLKILAVGNQYCSARLAAVRPFMEATRLLDSILGPLEGLIAPKIMPQ